MTELEEQKTPPTNNIELPKVGIVGAGISGLSTAIALKNLGVDVSVLEQSTKEARKWGYNLTLMDSTIDHLKEFNESIVNKLDLQHSRPATRIPLYDDDKELVFIPGPKKEDNVVLYRVSKDQLHKSLVECCESLGIKINWGTDFHHYEEYLNQNGKDPILLTNDNALGKDESDIKVRVVATKNDGKEPQTVEHTFDILIGADGAQSDVRKQIKYDKKKFLNVVAINGVLDASGLENVKASPRLTDYYSFIQLGKGDSIWATLIDNELNWLVHLPAREVDLKNTVQDKEQMKANLLRQLTITHSLIRSIIEHTPAENISTPQGVYAQEQMALRLTTKRVVNTLGGRVTLIGDASNHCLPFLGQGANLAVKHAHLFTKELRAKVAEFDPQSTDYKDLSRTKQKNKLIDSFLSDAEIEISRRSKPFITGSEAGSAWFHKKGFLSRSFRNGALRLLGKLLTRKNI
jgi:2-polyprenyl-6-methoxyphenol hydroxylase-like FAD-dependent oxidoreductase